MACGRAVIGTSVGAIPEMLNAGAPNAAGICVAPKNMHELYVAIETVLGDKEFAISMGKNGASKILNEYSQDKVMAKLLKIWGV